MAETSTGRLAIHQLEPAPDEALVWVSGGLARIGAALEVDLRGPHAATAIDELLRLMSVLRNQRASPATADALGDLIRTIPAARAAVRGRLVATGGIDRARSFAQREGRAVALRAPTPTATSPAGALPLRALLDPQRGDRARALRAKTKEPSHDK